MCKNYDSEYPGSKVYNNDEANRAIYGGLYEHSMVMNPGFCPAGWHVPTLVEVQELIDFLGGNTVAGGKLKEAGLTHWNNPNTGATNSSGFTALGAGYWSVIFANLKAYGMFWTVTEGGLSPYCLSLNWNDAIASTYQFPRTNYLSVRLIKNFTKVLWFLPSKDELELIKINLYDAAIGNLNDGTYWSSSEHPSHPPTQAYGLNFPSSSWIDAMKTNLYYVRAIRSFTSSVVYNIGDIGPSGGWIFYKDGNNYLECAPVDQSVSNTWSNIANLEVTTNTGIGTGASNTVAIMAQLGHTDSAAKLCFDYIP
jgi:uncharacterized protein (TIGR02145 family)